MSEEWIREYDTNRRTYQYVPPPIGVPVEDVSCAKCAELTERYRMQSETLGRYVDEKLALENRLTLLAMFNAAASKALRGELDLGKEHEDG